MDIILIDDEVLLLNLLEHKIRELTNATIVGKYSNPHQGLYEVQKKQPDIVFIDIAMPELNGIELAKEIKESNANIKIVFLTAYDQYAIKAFDLGVDDYILKPINDDRLLETFSRISKETITEPNINTQYYIGCFHSLHFREYNKSKNIIDIKWRTNKSREVFAFLLHNRDKQVRKDVIVDLIWADVDVKQAYAQLYSSIYQIRNSLKNSEIKVDIVSSENSYTLKLINCTTDVDLFEDYIDEASFITKENIEHQKEILKLYTNDYFADEDFPWAVNLRNRLHIKWVNHLKRVADYFILTENHPQAILVYLQLQKVAPYRNESYIMLMKLYNKLNDRFAVQEQYEALVTMLLDEFDETPDSEVQDWYNNWKEKQS